MSINSVTRDFGASTITFRELDVFKSLGYLKNAGFRKIDLTVVPGFCPHWSLDEYNETKNKKLVEYFNKNNLILSSLNIAPGYINREKYEVITNRLFNAAKLAYDLKCNIITMPAGTRVEESEYTNTLRMITTFLREIAKRIYDQYVVFISVETPHKNTFTETITQSIDFHNEVDSEYVRCTLDTSHVNLEKYGNIDAYFDSLGNIINHVHLRDAIDDDISFTPGKGDIDFKKILTGLNNSIYDGDYILELEYHSYSIKRRLKELDFASDYLTELKDNNIGIKSKIKSNKYYTLVEGLFYNPVEEIKRNKAIYSKLKKTKNIITFLRPENVFEGRWVRKYRFNKKRNYRPKFKSIIIENNPAIIYKIAVIGLGYAGNMHAFGFARLNNCKIIGGVDINHHKRKTFKNIFHCKTYESIQDMISQNKPDIVSICTREWLHYKDAKFCIENDIDVFCEKLLTTRIDEANILLDLVKRKNRVLAVNYNYRFIPPIQKLKEIIEVQALGKLCHFSINVHAFSYAHAIDLLTYLGGKIKNVSGYNLNDNNFRDFAGTNWDEYDDDIQYIPSMATCLAVEYENGNLGVINSSRHYPLPTYIMSIEAVFTEGIVNINGLNQYNVLGKLTYNKNGFGKIKKVDINYKKHAYTSGYELPFYESVKSFMEHYISDKEFEVDVKQAIFNMNLEKKLSAIQNKLYDEDFNI
jgi:predicted dehydrogenase/sugar phosphate isomerase/epimerase